VALGKSGNADGIGFVLTPDMPYAAIDVDGCRDVQTGSLLEWGQDFLEHATLAGTYAEITPSGSGIRIWGLTEAASDQRVHVHHKLGPMIGPATDKASQVELYRRTNQYIAITGLKISSSNQLDNVDRVFDWAPRWAAMHPRPKEAKTGNGQHPISTGPIANMSIEDIDRIIEEGAPAGERSELFHGICWHFAGLGYSIEEIEGILAEHPGGIAKRYIDEGRLLVREVARCLSEHEEGGIQARAILAGSEGKRASRDAKPVVNTPKGNGAKKPDPDLNDAATARAEIPTLEEMREELLDLGFTNAEIDQMTPESAWKRLKGLVQSDNVEDHDQGRDQDDDDFSADDGGDAAEDEDEDEIAPLSRSRPVPRDDEDDIDLDVVNAGLDASLPPPRAWLLANQFCRGFVSSLISPGGVGKTTVRLAQYIALTTGREITGQKVYTRCRVLVLSFEDDEDELRRRIHAICKTYDIPMSELDGWLFYSCPKKRLKLAKMDPRRGPCIGKLEEKVRKKIEDLHIDLVGFDPLVKVHAISENDNTGMDFVVGLLTELAIDYKIAVDAPHHSRKGPLSPGDADSGRGASAIVDAGRLNYTLTPMTDEEMGKFPEIKPEDDRLFVRLDPAKVNILKKSRLATWFKLIDVPLGNATALYPEGDHVQSITPFKAQAIGAVISDEIKEEILTAIERGPIDPATGQPTGQRYTAATGNVKERAAWRVVAQFVPELTEAACREWINEQLGKTLESRPYRDPTRKGKADQKQPLGLFRI
jgi:hypothetical protein